jgi:hypothetical protein
MKSILVLIASLALVGTAYAGGEIKEVCKNKLDKAGKVVNGKDGKPTQVCKKIKVHEKAEGHKVPEPAKKK